MLSKLNRQVKLIFYSLLGHLFANFNATKKPIISIIQYIVNNDTSEENLFMDHVISIFWNLCLVLYYEFNIDVKDNIARLDEALSEYNELIAVQQNSYILAKQYFGFIGDILSSNTKIVNSKAEVFYDMFKCFLSIDDSTIAVRLKKLLGIKLPVNSKQTNIDEFIKHNGEPEAQSYHIFNSQIYLVFSNMFGSMTRINEFEFKHEIEKIVLELCLYNREVFFENCIKIYLRIHEYISDEVKEFFHSLKNKRQLKDTLLTLPFEKMTQTERSAVLRFLKSGLIVMYFSTKGQKNKNFILSKQNFILDFISGLPSKERKDIIDHFFSYLGFEMRTIEQQSEKLAHLLCNKNIKHVEKLLKFMKLLVKNFGILAKDYSTILLNFLIEIFDFYTQVGSKNKKEGAHETNSRHSFAAKVKAVKRNTFDILTIFYISFPELDYSIITKRLLELIKPQIDTLQYNEVSNIHKIAKLFFIWSELETYKINFIEHSYLIPSFIPILSSKNITSSFAEKIFEFLNRLIMYNGNFNLYKNNEQFLKQKLLGMGLVHDASMKDDSYLYVHNRILNSNVSIIGEKLIHDHSNLILTQLNGYCRKEKNLKGKKYVPSDGFILAVEQVVSLSHFIDQNSLGMSLELLKENLDPSKINTKVTGNPFDDAQKFIKRQKYKASLLKTFALVSRILEKYTVDPNFFLRTIMNLFIELSDPELFMELKPFVVAVSSNQAYKHLLPSLRILMEIFSKSKKIENDLNYDIVYTQLEEAQQIIDEHDDENVELLLMIALRLLTSKDKSVRTQSLQLFKVFFDKATRGPKNENTSSVLTRITDHIKKFVNKPLPKDEQVKYLISLIVSYIEFTQTPLVQEKYPDLPYMTDNLADTKRFLPDFTDLKLTYRISQMTVFISTIGVVDYTFAIQVLLPLLENLLFSKLQEQQDSHMPAASRNNNIVNYANITIDMVAHLTQSFTATQIVAYVTKKANFMKKQLMFGETVAKMISKVLNHLNSLDSNAPVNKPKIKKLTTGALPILKKILYEDKRDNKKPQPALCECILKLIRLGGEKIFKAEFGKLVNQSTVLVKNKETRNKGLKLLYTISNLAGFENFGVVLDDIKEQLGQQRNVRNYSIRYLLDRLLTGDPNTHTGKLDHCVKDLILFIKEEAFAEFFDDRAEDRGKKMANAKAIIKLLGSVVSLDAGVI